MSRARAVTRTTFSLAQSFHSLKWWIRVKREISWRERLLDLLRGPSFSLWKAGAWRGSSNHEWLFSRSLRREHYISVEEREKSDSVFFVCRRRWCDTSHTFRHGLECVGSTWFLFSFFFPSDLRMEWKTGAKSNFGDFFPTLFSESILHQTNKRHICAFGDNFVRLSLTYFPWLPNFTTWTFLPVTNFHILHELTIFLRQVSDPLILFTTHSFMVLMSTFCTVVFFYCEPFQ